MRNVMVDSTVWIEFFRSRNAPLCDLVAGLLDEDRASASTVILAEVLCGARTQKEYGIILDTLQGVHLLEDSRHVFLEAAELGFRLRRKGQTVPLADLLIAVQCARRDLGLLTLDGHFSLIADAVPLRLERV